MVNDRPFLHPKVLLVMADAMAVALGVVFAFVVQSTLRPVSTGTISRQLLLLVVALPGLALGAGWNRLYQARANERRSAEFWNVVRAAATGLAGLVTVSFLVQFAELSRLWVSTLALGVTLLVLVERQMARVLFRRMRAAGRMTRRIVIVGTDSHAIGLMHSYERNPALGYSVVGFVGDEDIGERAGVQVLGPVTDLKRVLAETGAPGVVVSLSSINSDQVNAITRQLTEDGIHVALSTSLRDIDVGRLRPQALDGRTMIYVEPVLRDGWRSLTKRVFDVALASILLIVTSPLLLASVIAIRLDSRGPIFFHQTRVGRNGRPFQLTKLRTMTVDAESRRAEVAHLNESDGPLFKIRNDPRITPAGRVLRKLSLDELPQLWSVIRGTMSMVGPRPALPDEVELWDDETIERLRVLPGLTGLWQVSGRSDSSFDSYKRLDLYYVDNWSLAHDAVICARTVKVVLTGNGAA